VATRSFSPLLTRRAAQAPKPAARPAAPTRTTGAATGVPRFAAGVPKATTVSQRNDHWEGEAHHVSTAAHTSPATSAARQRTPSPAAAPAIATAGENARAKPIHRPPSSRSIATRAAPVTAARPRPVAHPSFSPATSQPTANAPPGHQITPTTPLSGSSGSPLNPVIRQRLESVLGVSLSAIRVHTGPVAEQAAVHYEARAFTIGSNIYLRSGESATDLALIAHETAHAVQQTSTLLAAPPRGPPSTSAHTLSRAPVGMVQRLEAPDWLKAAGNAIAHPIDTAGKVADAAGEVIAEGFWAVVDKLAPKKIAELLHDIRDHGFIGVLKTKVSAALDFVFSSLKAQGGTAAKIATIFETLIAKAKPIFAALAAGDCKPLFAAVKSLGEMLGKMAGDAWDKITTFLKPVGDWLTNVWNKFGAPIVDFLKEFASDTWDWIKNLGQDLWDLTKPVRDFYSGAWTEIKNVLGFGEGNDDDGSGGVVGWIKTQAGEIWDGIKTELKPVIEPIKKAATAINDFLPMKDILNLREKINEWLDKATAMADNMDQPDDVADNQDLLRDIILPGIKRAIANVRGKVVAASTWATTAIGGLVGKVTDFFSNLSSNTLLSPLSGVIQWLSDEAVELGTWATEKVAGLFAKVDQALAALDHWIEPVVKTLQKLVNALGDLMGNLGDLVLGPLLLIPKCIRDPIKDFVVTKILSKIPIFAQLVELPAIWAKIQPAFRAVVVSIFRDGNLFKAAWIFFRTILDLLGVPPQLVTNLIRNAAKAFKDILNDPVGFLGNLLTSIKLGLLQFVDNIGKHLLKGAVDWLLSGVKGPGIKIADPFTINLKNVLDLVLQVLDLTKEKIFERIEKKKGKDVADKVRKMVKVADKALEWISILFTEGPAGLWKHLQKELSNLWDTMLGMVIDFLIGKIVQQATIWVTKTLASGGLSVIIDAVKAVYDALQVIAQYLKQMLEVANSVCEGIIDIAKGVLNKAADMVEDSAARLIPMVLAWIAKTLGIGDLPVVIGEGIQKVRTKVEDAIDTLIDKTFSAIDWAKQKIEQLKEWWKSRKEFTVEGEKHAVYLEGGENGAKIMVASTPITFVSYVTALKVDDKKKKAHQDAIALAQKIDTEVAAAAKDKTTAKSKSPTDHSATIDDLMAELSEATKVLMSKAAWGKSSPTVYGPLVNTFGSSASIERLTPDHDEGSAAANAPGNPNWDNTLRLRRSASGGSSYYVRGHLLNDNLGGPAQWTNLTPITQEANNRSATSMLHNFERDVKEKVNKDKQTVSFSVTANYGQPSRAADIAKAKTMFTAAKAALVVNIMTAEQTIPRSLDCTAYELKADGTKGVKVATYRAENDIDTDAKDYNV